MTTDEIFENVQTLMDEPETAEDYFNIDWYTREITIPKAITNLGVYNDKDTNRLYFRCPVQYGEFSVADFGIRINYKNGSTTGDAYLVSDVKVSDGYLTFSWLVGRNAYLLQSSTTQFSVCCKIIDEDGNIVNELNTTIASLKVLQGLETEESLSTSYPDLMGQLENIAEKALTGIKVNGEAAPVTDHVAEIEVVVDIPIEQINVNGVEQEIVNKTVDISVPTKVSELENDSNYISVEETEKEIAEQIAEIVADAPESLDTLKEIADWIENHADDAAAMNSQINQNTEDIKQVEESALTGIKVNGEDASVTDHVAELTIEESNGSVYYATVTDDNFEKNEIVIDYPDDFKLKNGVVINLIFDCEEEHYANYLTMGNGDGVAIYESFYITTGLVTLVYNRSRWRTTKLLQDVITSITVNGEDVPVEDNKAEITVSGAEPSVEDETLIF